MKVRLCASVTLMACCALVMPAIARPLDTLATCASGARLERAVGVFEGTAAHALRDSRFAAAHERGTREFGATWLSRLDGRSGAARVYVDGARHVLVLTVCAPGDCDRSRAYVAYEAATRSWGASLYLDGQTQELGEAVLPGSAQQRVPKALAPAIVCAQNADWAAQR